MKQGVCFNVAVVDDSIRTLLDDMLETMYANDGIGLAAVQIGVHKRCIVVDVGVRETTDLLLKNFEFQVRY